MEVPFVNFKNFTLAPGNWGNDPLNYKVPVMESIIKEFYSVLDCELIPNKPVVIMRRNDGPQYNDLGSFDVIGLDTQDMFWSQFSYQLAHELCHHVIRSNWFTIQSKFGWFEESICEMASIYVMRKMSITWLTAPPYFMAETFASSIAKTSQINMNRFIVDLNCSISEWLSSNIDELENNRYLRAKNAVVAYNLLPIFTEVPQLWRTIQYLNLVSVNDEMKFDQFLNSWKNVLPEELKDAFQFVLTILNS